MSKSACLRDIKSRAAMMKWGIRIVGWIMLFAGMCSFFGPFNTLLRAIPFIGPVLAGVTGFVTGLFSFIVTVLLAILIIAMAYLTYHPMMGIAFFALVAAIVVFVIVISAYDSHSTASASTINATVTNAT